MVVVHGLIGRRCIVSNEQMLPVNNPHGPAQGEADQVGESSSTESMPQVKWNDL